MDGQPGTGSGEADRCWRRGFLGHLTPPRAAIETIPETLPGLRDRALPLVGFAAALRPSEIARLTLEHLTRHPDGTELFLPWRKNDQDAQRTKLWLPQGRTELCPVKALAAAAISDGPLFRRIWRLRHRVFSGAPGETR